MTSLKERVKCEFSERADEWAACYAYPTPRSLSALNLVTRQRIALEMIERGVPRAGTVLDLGCGTGEMAVRLMDHGYETWGLDIAEPMIRYARERCGSERFRVGDIEHLPFPDNTFDAVVCLGVIEYLETDERALREMWRVLKPGGKAVISTPSATSPFYHASRMLVALLAVARPPYHLVKYRLRGRRRPVRQPRRQIRNRRYYRRSWLRLLRSVNLAPEKWACHGWGWPSSWLGPVAQSRHAGWLRNILERLGPARVCRAFDRVARRPALNWLLAEQVVRVRAVK